jgi:hypothetical protein
MIRFKHFLSWLTLAAALTGTCGQAAATPLYHVDIDTASLGTGRLSWSCTSWAWTARRRRPPS